MLKTLTLFFVMALAICGQQTQQARIVIWTDAGITAAYVGSPNPSRRLVLTGVVEATETLSCW